MLIDMALISVKTPRELRRNGPRNVHCQAVTRFCPDVCSIHAR